MHGPVLNTILNSNMHCLYRKACSFFIFFFSMSERQNQFKESPSTPHFASKKIKNDSSDDDIYILHVSNRTI